MRKNSIYRSETKAEDKTNEQPKSIESGRVLTIMLIVAGLGGAIWLLLASPAPGHTSTHDIYSPGMICTCVPASSQDGPLPHNMAEGRP